MVNNNDTIVAISTAPGTGAIGIVRISGPGALKTGKQITGKTLKPRYATQSSFRDKNKKIIDNGIAIYFPAPNSYTGEDMLELHAHGNRLVLEQVIETVLQNGARRAHPGEFTERAFLNSKMDLVQAEAVADLIEANNLLAASSAARSIQGKFSEKINLLQNRIISIRTLLEAELDFSEEEISHTPEVKIKNDLIGLKKEITDLLDKASYGQRLKEGIDIVIMGKPNIGKSTLLNQLASKDAAIVSASAGTTRDLIEVDILMKGIPVHITDTAGLRNARNEIEQEGIKRAQDRSTKTDLILFLLEPGKKLTEEEREFIDKNKTSGNLLSIFNKIDMVDIDPKIETNDKGETTIYISAKKGTGLDLLVDCIYQRFSLHEVNEDLIVARKRHISALEVCNHTIEQAYSGYENHKKTELLADDLRRAQKALDEITGVFAADDLLGKIFSEFCIGK